jgi:aspartyl-tRNA(Asn)/glutamyl-tRNA(Gln) amidotransferase subunit A
MPAVAEHSAAELREFLVTGQISVEELTRDTLRRIEERDPQLQAYNDVYPELALNRARELDKAKDKSRFPLFGIPLALKDNLCTTFGRTTCSSRILSNFQSPYTATAVSRLIDAGAVVLGKTNMDEFAMGSSTENSRFKITRNPWDTSRVPGGSSGGSAAAVSARLCAAALGSDTGGSVRQPAAFCGVVGLKPTYGSVSRFGLVAYGSSLDQIGPITQNVTDCALLMGVIAGHDPKDSTSVAGAVPDYLRSIDTPINGMTIGIPREYFTDALDEETAKRLDTAMAVFRDLGAAPVDVSLPTSRIDRDPSGELSSFAVACYYIIAMAEASSNLSRYDGVHYGTRSGENIQDIIELYERSRSDGFGEEVKRRIMLGTYALSSGYYDAYYLKALKVRRLIKADFDRAFQRCDLLLAPVSPTAAFKIGEKIEDPLTMYLQDIYTLSLNLAGLPGLSIPCGFTRDRLPIGMQLIGPVFSEPALFRAGRCYEKASGFSRLSPPGADAGRRSST